MWPPRVSAVVSTCLLMRLYPEVLQLKEQCLFHVPHFKVSTVLNKLQGRRPSQQGVYIPLWLSHTEGPQWRDGASQRPIVHPASALGRTNNW